MFFLRITDTDGSRVLIPDKAVISVKTAYDQPVASTQYSNSGVYRGPITRVKYMSGGVIFEEYVDVYDGSNKLYEYGMVMVDESYSDVLSNKVSFGYVRTIASILSKYSGSHHWDFGVSSDKVAAGASMTPSQFAAAYPAHALFQDTAGTTPAYQITHPVALCKDAVGTAHASQSTSTKRPVLSARVNLLVATEDFSNAAWALSTASISANSASSPVGTLTADKVSASSFGNSRGVYASVTALATRYKTSVYAKSAESSRLCIYSEAGTAAGVAWFNLASGTVGTVASGYTATIASCGSGWFQCTVESLFTAGTRYAFFGPVDADNSVYSTASTGIYLWGADIRPANSPTNLPAYQRVTTSTDYDLTGFPLRAVWDGVDDCLVVPTLDLSITDKVTVVAGVTKLADASTQVLFELSTDSSLTAGSVGFTTAANGYRFRTGGSTPTSFTISSLPPPAFNVATLTSSISADSAVLNVNGTTVTSALDQGTGNFRSDAFYIGQRAGTSLPFSGAIQSITLIPALITASETAVIESSVNNSMGRVY